MSLKEQDVSDSTTPKKSKIWLYSLIFISLIFLMVLYWLFIYKGKHPVAKNKTLPVVIAKVEKKDIPVYFPALGTVTSTDTVTIQSQVNGILLKLYFEEGQRVKRGDLLAKIDPSPYLAQLSQYQGQLLHDQALLANAKIDLKRYQILWKQDSIPQQTLATQEALVKQYEGSVEEDKGLIEATKVNLRYCRITSPIDGRVGLRQVDPGNLIQTTDVNGLVIVTAEDPITVIFSLPEEKIPELMASHPEKKKLKVYAYDRQESKVLAEGSLISIDNLIDTSTGTLKLRAGFDNKDRALFPNQFVNIKLLVKTLTQVKTIPTAAIQHRHDEDFVYVLGTHSKVSLRKISASLSYDDDTVIKQGLKLGEKVVTTGADKLFDGAVVSVTNQKPPPAKMKLS